MTAPEADALGVLQATHPDPAGEAMNYQIRVLMYGLPAEKSEGFGLVRTVLEMFDTLDGYADAHGVTFPDPVGAVADYMPLPRDFVQELYDGRDGGEDE